MLQSGKQLLFALSQDFWKGVVSVLKQQMYIIHANEYCGDGKHIPLHPCLHDSIYNPTHRPSSLLMVSKHLEAETLKLKCMIVHINIIGYNRALPSYIAFRITPELYIQTCLMVFVIVTTTTWEF